MKIFNKKINLFIALALLCLINPVKVFAADVGYSKSRLNSCVNDGTCLEMCGYNNIVDDSYGATRKIYSVYVYYSYEKKDYFFEWFENLNGSSTQYGIEGQNGVNFISISSPARSSLEKGTCPKNAFVETASSPNVCFDDSSDDKGYCKDIGFIFPKYKGSSTLEFDYAESMNNWIDKWAYGDIKCPDDIIGLNSKEEFKAMVKQKYVQDFMNYTHTNQMPYFMENLLNSKFDRIYDNNYKDFYSTCVAQIEEAKNNGQITDEEAEDLKNNIDITEEDQDEINEGSIGDIVEDEPEEKPQYTGKRYCGIFGKETWKIIQTLYGIVKVLIPVLVVILGMIDFATVVFSGEDKDMKTAGQRFIKRIIIGVVLLLLPAILGFIFNLVGFSEGCLADLMK